MSYSIISVVVLLALVAVSSSSSNIHLSDERNVFVRFYPTFAQLYRPVPVKSSAKDTSEQYRFSIPATDYAQIVEESLSILYANVTDRTITYHPMPNFEEVGTRYFYHRDPKDSDGVEIELVNVEDRLFRDVRRPNRYMYLPSFDGLEYASKIPVMPYYEVTFQCKPLTSANVRAPLLSYIEKSLQWTPRYILELPSVNSTDQPDMYAYADIVNNGERSVLVEGFEFVAGDVKLNARPPTYFPTAVYYDRSASALQASYQISDSSVRSLGKQASGTYIYQGVVRSSPLTLAPRSTKSIEFLQPNATVDAFHYYSAEFTPINAIGKLSHAYNITSHNHFIPNGRLLLREEGAFVGQIDLPDLAVGETHTMVFGSDADVAYRRQVRIVEGDEETESITYHVEYTFENYTPTRAVRLYFIETFTTFKYFQIKNISKLDNHAADLFSYGTELRGHMTLARGNDRKTVTYQVTMYKMKPVFTIRQ